MGALVLKLGNVDSANNLGGPGGGLCPEPPGRYELGRLLDLGLVRPEQAQMFDLQTMRQ